MEDPSPDARKYLWPIVCTSMAYPFTEIPVKCDARFNIIVGEDCVNIGTHNLVLGNKNSVRGNRNIVLGNDNDITGENNIIRASGCTIIGDGWIEPPSQPKYVAKRVVRGV